MGKRSKNEIVSGVTDISISFADNGFVVEYSGQDDQEDWQSAKLVLTSLDAVLETVKDVVENRR
jgi:hypothetical protein